jgi:hypothetical protein
MKSVKNTVLTMSILVFKFHIGSSDSWVSLQVLGTHIKYTSNKYQNARVNAIAKIKIIWQMDVTFVLMTQRTSDNLDLVYLQIYFDKVCFLVHRIIMHPKQKWLIIGGNYSSSGTLQLYEPDWLWHCQSQPYEVRAKNSYTVMLHMKECILAHNWKVNWTI